MRIPKNVPENKILAILLVVVIITMTVRVVDIDKPYETWDEITTYSLGLNMWYNIVKGDFSSDTWKTYNPDWSGSLHPPLVRYTYGIVNGGYMISQTGFSLFSSGYDDAVYQLYIYKNLAPGRALSAVFAAATAVLLFLMTRKYFGVKTAVVAALLFALLPVSIAQTKIAALDAMLVFMYTVTLYLFIKGLENKKYFYVALIFTGLSIATKYNSATLFALLPLLYFAFPKPKAIGKKYLFLIPIVSLIVLFLIWPRFWPDPIGAAFANVNGWLAMGGGNVGEYLLGQFSTRQPAYYDIIYLLVTAPAILISFFFLGAIKSVKTAFSKKDYGHRMFLLWFLVPLILYSLFQFKMNGPRYTFMIYPAFAALMAIGIMWFIKFVKTKTKSRGNIDYYAIVGIIFAYLIVSLVLIHPYYLDYYNEFTGGPKNVYENNLFVVGRWGEGIGEASYYVYDIAEENATVQFFVMPRHAIPPLRENLIDLTPFVPKYISEKEQNENWDLTGVTAKAEYIVENTYFRVYMNVTFNKLISNDYDLIHTVEAQGAPLAWIYKRK